MSFGEGAEWGVGAPRATDAKGVRGKSPEATEDSEGLVPRMNDVL